MARPGDGGWTDWNVHDPGVTLLEVLAYGIVDLASGLGRRLRAGRCGWRCALVIAAAAAGGAAGAVLLARPRRTRPAGAR